MSRIQVLPLTMREKIAAGEVIDRPASVVKELLENAIDSGARRIRIDISRGGREMIRLTDDGQGIDPEDMILAVQRYATSKIEDEEDLYRIGTLGFRGEALASIRAVSRLRIVSRTSGVDEGSELISDAAGEHIVNTIGAPPGTEVTVTDIFYSLPARLKFMKSDLTEQRRIQEVVERYALSYAEIAFVMTADGREVMNAASAETTGERLVDIYGRQALGSFVEVRLDDAETSLEAWVSRPSLTRSNRNDQTIFVNGRLVQSPPIRFAVEHAYREMLPTGRYPLAVLKIRIPSESLDVNVHPQKTEIRIENEREVAGRIERAIRRALLESKMPSFSMNAAAEDDIPAGYVNRTKKRTVEEQSLDMPLLEETRDEFITRLQGREPLDQQSANEDVSEPSGDLILLGQALDMYVVAFDRDSILLVDQHAAHERILYDRLMNGLEPGHEIQVLLIPEVVEFKPAEATLLQRYSKVLKDMGFSIEPFGGNSYRLTEVPLEVGAASGQELLRDIVADLMEAKNILRTEEIKAILCRRAACHGAVKAGDRLSMGEMKTLLKEISGIRDHVSTCPHGRPIVVRMSQAELLKAFCRS